MKHTLLLIDHNEKNIASLELLLVASGYEVMIASTQEELSKGLRKDDIHLALVNTSTAFIELSWICSFVRKEHQRLPVFFISNGSTDTEEVTVCFENGGNDYLQKPINTKELLSRINFHIDYCGHLAEVEQRNERLANLATYDQLTKLSSRLHMQTLLRQQIQLLERQEADVSLIYVRILKFSKVNTLLGYTKGDKVLHLFAQTLQGMVRKSDVVGRWGGGDFVIMLPNADGKSALSLAKKINKLLITSKILERYSLKYSFGVVELHKDETVALLIDRSRNIMEEAAGNTHKNILID